ncbi:MAG: hydrogenase nickel incorporation protein HypA [Candidatus Thermoplasmatota archaeon]
MHEWALAESILAASVETAKKEKLSRITEINVKLGELQQINEDIFKKAVEDMIDAEGSELLEKAEIKIETAESIMECKKCGHVWKFKDMKKQFSEDESESIHFLPEVAVVHKRCSNCGSPDFEIKQGRGVTITSIKGEK